MGSEAVPWRCHRRLITDALIIARVEVLDIMSASSTRRAEMNAFARVHDGRITYPDERVENSDGGHSGMFRNRSVDLATIQTTGMNEP
ncbi:MAG: DUF488 domain-containing protein [Cryobacterium sp.]|uniref:hypothetical protein n=1 Tax=unclassified Cryobacterium TaxID=2649013 RepID=UPI0018C92AE7|nr:MULTISPECIES: hypothetical protein [unclassified Cryobacterium]MCY7405576.1 DUF488 domain-containing protein [Cryobacterium sp.]MEC5154437.1 hypothetical protein [Cryobacterium sp. CAN_C3]